ncbi:hypothetical protein M0805_000014 [Coniferiporia weirii]|nr:hypothetical protein M0805_000014 [Coniferiporia weirii]
MEGNSSPQYPELVSLQRGKACITCRYGSPSLSHPPLLNHLLKCDGARPVCTQCLERHCAEDCEYTDNQGRTRVQTLEENIALLQSRINDLENPDHSSRSIVLQDPYKTRSGSPGMSTVTESLGTAPTTSSPSWWEFEEPPAQIIEGLMNAFFPHASTLGFALSPIRFRAALNLPAPDPIRPHPALLNAVLLWAIRLSNAQHPMECESVFLQRTTVALQNTLGDQPGSTELADGQRMIVQIIQAKILLVHYFFSFGRLIEGLYHLNTAGSLVVGCGLHRISTSHPGPFISAGGLSNLGGLGVADRMGPGLFELPLPKDALELGERIGIFWAVHTIDCFWSTASGTPSIFGDSLKGHIETPWPLDVEDYEFKMLTTPALVGIITEGGTIQTFFTEAEQQNHSHGEVRNSRATIRAKSTVLYERATRLVSAWHSAPNRFEIQSTTEKDIEIISLTITRFMHSLDSLGLQEHPSRDRDIFLVAYALIHAAMIQICSVRESMSGGQGQDAMNVKHMHAEEIMRILETISGESNSRHRPVLVDPVLSVIGVSAAQVFVQGYTHTQNLPQGDDLRAHPETIRARIYLIKEALKHCAGISNACPIFYVPAGIAQQAMKIEELMHG